MLKCGKNKVWFDFNEINEIVNVNLSKLIDIIIYYLEILIYNCF